MTDPGRPIAIALAVAWAAMCACSDSTDVVVPTRPLETPVLLDPADQATFTTDVERQMTLQWNSVGLAVTYDVTVDFGTSCSSAPIVCATWTNDPAATDRVATLSHDIVFTESFGRWRVRGRGSLDEPGPWSAWRTFRFGVPPPTRTP